MGFISGNLLESTERKDTQYITNDPNMVQLKSSTILDLRDKPISITLTGEVKKIKVKDNTLSNQEIAYILVLDHDLFAVADNYNNPERMIATDEIHIYNFEIELDKYIGKTVTVSGDIYPALTVHHYRPLVLGIDKIQFAN